MPTLESIIFYNEASAEKLGWDPSWFGCDEFDENLVKAIKIFQRDVQLDDDGKCGPATWRRKTTEREANIALLTAQHAKIIKGNPYILCAGQKIPISWPKVKHDLKLHPGRRRDTKAELKQFVIHHDAALSATSCHKILKKRGLGVQFAIDNDGTIYQFHDANHVAWHCRGVNFVSAGVEVSNAVLEKYQRHYKREGFGSRPVMDDIIHGHKYHGMGYYSAQIEALKALIKALCDFYDIPICVPTDENGDMIKTVYKPAVEHKYSGLVAHYNISRNKWDPFGMDLKALVDEINDD